MQYAFIWLSVIILALAVEGMTTTLTAIWFAAGGLVAMVFSFFIKNVTVQFFVFIISSAVALILTRPLVKNKLTPKKVSTNYDILIGKKASVAEKIEPMQGKGQINFQGQLWSAKSENNKVIEKDKIVIINSIKGVHAIVVEENEREEK